VPAAATEPEAGAGSASPQAGATSGERVERPDPGLARGRWEAPPYVFYGVAAATLIGGVTVAIRGLRKPRR
jgi:hypothetical protein